MRSSSKGTLAKRQCFYLIVACGASIYLALCNSSIHIATSDSEWLFSLMAKKKSIVPRRTVVPPSISLSGGKISIANTINDQTFVSSTVSSVVNKPRSAVPVTVPPSILDRVFYINSFANPLRRRFMEDWLKAQSTTHHYYYDRIEAMAGHKSKKCDDSTYYLQQGQQREECLSSLRLASSYGTWLERLSYYGINPSATALVLHNDNLAISDWNAFRQALKDLPSDWSVVRLNCKDTVSSFNDHQPRNITTTRRSSCGTSKAILWRNNTLREMKRTFKKDPDVDVDCHVTRSNRFQSYCLNSTDGFLLHQETLEKEDPQVSPILGRNGWTLTSRPSLNILQEQNRNQPVPNSFGPHQIDRIYYSNLQKNSLRRQNMETWLQNQPIPYKRINATIGVDNKCVKGKNNGSRCRGVSGISRTLVGIIDNENTTGLSLVLEDDFVINDAKNLERLQEAFKMVPDDWDIIRFECWGMDGKVFRKINRFVTDTSRYTCRSETQCWFCGGAHSMLFRGSTVHKLREMWSTVPYEGVDCTIAQWGKSHDLKSYCINIGVGDLYRIESELTDILKQ
jgi:hypothetical protein